MVLEMLQISEWKEGVLRKPNSVRGADSKCSLGSHESDSSSSRTGSCDLERKRNIGNT